MLNGGWFLCGGQCRVGMFLRHYLHAHALLSFQTGGKECTTRLTS